VGFCTSADGVRIALARSGAGPPLVRVANWFTHLDLDRQSAVWRHWFDFLSGGRTLIRYDPRGSGLSDRNVDDFSLDRWIEDLDAVVESAGLTRFPLIGLCQGGAVAAAYAARHPDRISRLVLYDSYPFGAYEKRAKVGDALKGGISWRCSDAVNSLSRKGYATCQRLPSPSCPIHPDSPRTR